MANQLSIPFKNTSPIDIRGAVKKFIIENHPETHPDAFRRDIDRWDQIRKDATLDNAHASKVHILQSYHAHLKFLLTKLPTDIGLDIPYSSAFNSSSPWTIIPNIAYERSAVLFNLAALNSQLAFSEDRMHPEGIKRALSHYQNAAGTLSYLVSSALPLLTASTDRYTRVYELSEPIISSLESLMLAQAQECAWQRAVLDRLNDALVAKLAAKVSSYYRTAFKCIQDAPTTIKDAFPLEWIIHIDIKANHFAAAAQYRRSMEDLSKNKYGTEISRLKEAQVLANKNSELARKANVAKSVLSDIKSLCDILQTNILRAERDNDLIYHQDIPTFSTLPPIQEISLVKPVISDDLMDPRKVVKEDVLFADLLPWGARNAINIYNDRRQSWLSEEIFGPAQQLDQVMDSSLQEMRLPASLEALDRPIGLPPSLLRKAEEVRLENGPERIEQALDNLDNLAQRNRAALDQASAMDILDQEAEEDEALRNASSQNIQWTSRPRSFEANADLIADERRYRTLLDQAAEGDGHLRDKWNEWEEAISRLTWGEDVLEEWVPSSTVPSRHSKSMQNIGTQVHARKLRSLLEVLDDIRLTRATLVDRIRIITESDDIRPKIIREATNMSLWTEVDAASFEPTLGRELMKYEKFKSGLEDNAAKQAEVLSSMKVENEMFISSRKEDKAVLEREHVLQSLDLAYHKYRDIIQDLEEGYSFYNHMAGLLSNFKDRCSQWVRERREEINIALSLNMESLRIDEHSNDQTPRLSTAHLHAARDDPRNVVRTRKEMNPNSFDLPPPDSEEWEATPDIPQGSHTYFATREGYSMASKDKGKKRFRDI